MRAAVIGGGPVGLATALLLTRLGYTVQLIERCQGRQRALRSGQVPYHEPGLQQEVPQVLSSGRLEINGTLKAEKLALVAICVGTPPGSDEALSTRDVEQALQALPHQLGLLTVIRSTLPPGTAEMLQAAHQHLVLGVWPEFLRASRAWEDTLAPARVVLGGTGLEALEQQLSSFFPQVPLFSTNLVSAELAKLAANALLAVRYSVMNEVADLARGLGADTALLSQVLDADPRLGQGWQVTPGWGGACLPKDAAQLVMLGKDLRAPQSVVQAALTANTRRQEALLERLASVLGNLVGREIVLLA